MVLDKCRGGCVLVYVSVCVCTSAGVFVCVCQCVRVCVSMCESVCSLQSSCSMCLRMREMEARLGDVQIGSQE